MANSLINISEIATIVELENEKELTYTEKLQRINRIKQNMGILYFTAVVIMLTSLIIF